MKQDLFWCSFLDGMLKRFFLATGGEAVTYMVNSSLAKSRKDAVYLGRRFQKELNLFSHVTGAHLFKDDFLFFKFSDQKKINRRKSLMSDITSPSTLSDGVSESQFSLDKIGDMLQKGVKTQDRRYHLRVYKDCFIGAFTPQSCGSFLTIHFLELNFFPSSLSNC